MQQKTRLTDAVVKRLPVPERGNKVHYDGSVAGFGCRITAAGHRAYVLDYRTKSGRSRRITIGDCRIGDRGDWYCTTARDKARELRREVDDGGDPLASFEAEREAPTVAELIETFITEHLPKRRASTREDYQRMLDKYIGPHFGKHVKVADVVPSDIEALHRRISAEGHLVRANAVVRVLSKMFTLSIKWGWRDTSPARMIEKNREYARTRFLQADELERLLAALAADRDRQSVNVIRLLLLSGCRRCEALGIEWNHVDLSTGVWSKPHTLTKQKEPHEVPLSAPARALLSDIRQQQISAGKLDAHVFPGGNANRNVVRLKRSWPRIVKAAKIDNLRVHDLRHSYASELVSSGSSLELIGALLGHASFETTKRYAHLRLDAMRSATERVGTVISNAGKPPAEEPTPISIRRR
jgi:integrase